MGAAQILEIAMVQEQDTFPEHVSLYVTEEGIRRKNDL